MKENPIKAIYSAVFFSITLFIILITFGAFNQGIEMSDEGFHINAALNTNPHFVGLSQFGKYTGLLFKICAHNLVLFRSLGLALLLLLSTIFALSLERTFSYIFDKTFSVFERILNLSLINLGSIMYYYRNWLPTPSYNWLNLVAMLIVGIGVVGLYNKTQKKENNFHLFAALVGFGIMLSFMTKPTTGLGLAIIVAFITTLSSINRHWLKVNIWIALFTIAFFTLHILLFEGGFSSFYQNILEALADKKVFKNNQNMAGILKKMGIEFNRVFINIMYIQWLPLMLLLFAGLVNYFSSKIISINQKHIKNFVIIVLVIAFTLVWVNLWGERSVRKRIPLGFSFLIFSIFSYLSVFVTGVSEKYSLKNLAKILFFFIPFMLLPYLFGLGSQVGATAISSSAVVFYCIALLYMAIWLDVKFQNTIFTFLITSIILISCMHKINYERNKPYRLATSISAQDTKVSFPNTNTSLLVDKKMAAYINKIQKLATDNGWEYGNYILDMTGASPLVAFILDAKPAGALWMAGGGNMKSDLVKYRLQKEQKETILNAWVITAPKGSRATSTEAFKDLDINFKKNYQLVGKMKLPNRKEQQLLWKPI